jgi:2-haloacid dehalogenase
MTPSVLAFDLNGTLLDMASLDGTFGRIFGSAAHRERWFEQLQVLWMTTLATGTFEPFETLAAAALRMVGPREGVDVSSGDQGELSARMAELPPFDDVPVALRALRAAGHRLVGLTNGTRKSARAQVAHAGLADPLDDVYAADQVERYKPAPEPYLYTAEAAGVEPARMLLVAAHAWDVAGAARAGLRTAFVRRPRQVLDPAGAKPD